MAKVYFVETSEGGSGKIPFLEEFVQKHEVNGMDFEIISIAETRNKNGYMLKTASFQALMWKSDPYKPILEDFMERMQNDNPGYMLGLTVNMDEVRGFDLYSDKAAKRFWSKQKKPGNLLLLNCATKASTKQTPTLL